MIRKDRILLFIGCGLLSIACLFYILANILPMWAKSTDRRGLVTSGLWASCNWDNHRAENDKWMCQEGGYMSLRIYAKILAARLFITIAGILTSFCVFSVVLILLVDGDAKKAIALLAKIFSVGSLVTGIISLALGINLVTTVTENASDPTATVYIYSSSVLAIFAVIFNLLGGVATFFVK